MAEMLEAPQDGDEQPQAAPIVVERQGNKNKQGTRAKRWCFTSFEENAPRFNERSMQALHYQQEISPQTGKKHWQGWVVFHDKIRLDPVKTEFGSNTIHLEIMKGSIRSNIAYCSKKTTKVHDKIEREDGTVIEADTDFETAVPGTEKFFGEKPEEEATMRYAAAKQDVKLYVAGGMTKKQLILDNFALMVQNRGNIVSLINDLAEPDEFHRPMCNILFWGEPGTGKTRWVAQNFKKSEVYFKPPAESGGDWWDGYEGQKVVVWDDFYGGHKFSNMLNWMDGYYRQVQRKGGTVNLKNHINIFTSNKPIEDWWPQMMQAPENRILFQAFRRRIPNENIIHVLNNRDMDFTFEAKNFKWIGDDARRERAEEE